MHWQSWPGMHGWMWLLWLVIILGVAMAVVWLLRMGRDESRRSTDESPEQILKRRLARGEIDEQEYEQKLKELRR